MLRKAVFEDARLLFDWANEAETRKMSIHSEPIAWDTHLAWFTRKLADPGTQLFILEEDNIPVGQLRLDRHNNAWMIGYSVDKNFRGKGYGRRIVSQAIDLFEQARFIALVKPGNTASIRIFQSLGFAAGGTQVQNGIPLLQFILDKK